MNFYGDIIVNIIGNNKLDNILAFLFYKGVDVKKNYKTYPILIILYNILI